MLYYKLKTELWVDEYDINRAFFINTGHVNIRNEKEFLIWLYDKLGKSIVEVRRESDPYLVDELIKAKQKALAAKVLYRQFGFTLAKAKEIVDQTEKELNAN